MNILFYVTLLLHFSFLLIHNIVLQIVSKVFFFLSFFQSTVSQYVLSVILCIEQREN